MGTSSSRNLSVLLDTSDDGVQSIADSSMTQTSSSSSDPRSPSAVIYRTPIQGKVVSKIGCDTGYTTDSQKMELRKDRPSGPSSVVTQMYRTPIQSRSQSMSAADGTSLINRKLAADTGSVCVLKNEQTGLWLMDPRSPSVGIDRTPIQVQTRKEEGNTTPSIEVGVGFREECSMLVDPRSPTDGIFRTPIQVKTIAVMMSPQIICFNTERNELRGERKEVLMDLPYSEIHPTPTAFSACNVFIDPRSPTAGIDRTPLAPNLRAELMDQSLLSSSIRRTQVDASFLDPRSPSAGVTRTPFSQIAKTSEANQEFTSSDTNSSPIIVYSMVADMDPRSPCIDINRTPLPLVSGSLSANVIVPILNLDCTPIAFDASASTEDPRSPTAGLDRTPIVFNLGVSLDKACAIDTCISSTPILLGEVIEKNPLRNQATFIDVLVVNEKLCSTGSVLQASSSIDKHEPLTTDPEAMEIDDHVKPAIDPTSAMNEVSASSILASPILAIAQVQSTAREIKKRKMGLKIVEKLSSPQFGTTKNEPSKVQYRSSWMKLNTDSTTERRSPLTARNGVNSSLNASKNSSSPLVGRVNADQPRAFLQRSQARRIESMKLIDTSSVPSRGRSDPYAQKMITTAVCRTPNDKENI